LITPLTILETALLLGLGWWLARRAPEAQAPFGRRLVAIAALIVAQKLVHYLFEYFIVPAGATAQSHAFHGLVWLTQAIRAALLLLAFRLWFGLVRPELGRAQMIAIVPALILMGFGPRGANSLGFVVLLFLASRFRWPRELMGWRRLVAALVSIVLLVLLVVTPQGGTGGASIGVSLGDRLWPPSLVPGEIPRTATELQLARPLDRLVEGFKGLFLAQLIVIGIRMLTLPIRLSGMSLRRRFLVNYLLVSQIPGLLGTLVTIVGAYFAVGIVRSGQARGELEQTLARGETAATALLADGVVAHGGANAEARLESARVWLGPDSLRASFVLREWDAAAEARAEADTTDSDSLPGPTGRVIARTAGTPEALVEFPALETSDGRWQGMIAADDRMYLSVRGVSSTPAPGRALDVFVPVDTAIVNRMAKRVGARVSVALRRGISVKQEGLSIGPDTTNGIAVRVKSTQAPSKRREWFLASSLIPVGDWRAGWLRGVSYAVIIELRTTLQQLLASLADVPGWLFSNIIMLMLIGGLLSLIGLTQGLAVRTGRSIVQAIEDEVAQLRAAASRFGAGDLAHRVPVMGRDELSTLGGAFNEMAANLERQRRELVEKERMEEELDVARQIQIRFLPQSAPSVPGLDVAGLSRPSREVGGDLFYYVALPENQLGVALGDVSGKSVPAALLMSNVMSALRAEAQHERVVEHSLERINRQIVESIEPGRFVTLFYGIVDPNTNWLRYTSAGHNPALRLTASGEIEWLRAGGVPLGVLDDSRYPGAESALEHGDTLIVYSDGVTEAEGPGRGTAELFGEDRLVDAVRALRGRSSVEIVNGILAAVQRFAADRPQADDITLVVVRRV
jgi:serine phosphatase RsbU (regulator of sigma subunit)